MPDPSADKTAAFTRPRAAWSWKHEAARLSLTGSLEEKCVRPRNPLSVLASEQKDLPVSQQRRGHPYPSRVQIEGPPSISRCARRRARSRKRPSVPGRRSSFPPLPGRAHRAAGAPNGPPAVSQVPRPRRTSRSSDRRSPRRPEPRNPAPPPPRSPRSRARVRRRAGSPHGPRACRRGAVS